MIVVWKTLAEKKPERERTYATTKEGIFGNIISHAHWFKGHFWRNGQLVDEEVIAWADGLKPYEEEQERRS